jgi:hypothetical protein
MAGARMSSLAPMLPKLCPLIRMLGSSNDGEALNAARAIGRTLRSAGRDFHDLASALEAGDEAPYVRVVYRDRPQQPAARDPLLPPTWNDMGRAQQVAMIDAILRADESTAWESEFLSDIRAQHYLRGIHLKPKQMQSMNGIIATAWLKGVRP